jgi:phosphatidylserine/phosphatidylglycerophosphate/cardiolipin synthase-like enzyme
MAIQARAYANCDEVTIVWQADAPIPNCRGFALMRNAKDAAGKISNSCVNTWVGFAGDPKAQSGIQAPSTEWPIQRYVWSDYFAAGASSVQYQVVPMIGPAASLQQAADKSDWTDWVSVGTQKTPEIGAWFNRGIIASQWVARALDKEGGTPASALNGDIAKAGDPLRDELGGPLKVAVLQAMAEANAAGKTIYAALYELNDPELMNALQAFGKRCNLLLGSGAYKSGKPDENAAARTALKRAGKINLFDRLVGSPHFAHNKFVVFCDADGTPERVWSGSLNWTMTGLCTQVNNGIYLDSPDLAKAYLARWNELKAAGKGYPASLLADGSKPGTAKLGTSSLTAWNAPCNDFVDLADARQLIRGARQGVLFLMFNPGPKGTLLNDILALDTSKLFVHGVVNQDPGGSKDPLLTFYDRGHQIEADPEATLPAAIKAKVKGWFTDEYKGNMVMVHSKVIVIDPFGSHPVVMTGSHNMGPKASSKNDDNLLIIENAPGLAAEYAVHVIGVYGHYKFRHNQQLAAAAPGHPDAATGWAGLQDDDKWQAEFFTGEKLREIQFWFGELGGGQ